MRAPQPDAGRAAGRRCPHALFCFDTEVWCGPDGEVRADPQFGYPLWRRYLEGFASVTVACREVPAASPRMAGLTAVASGPGVAFRPLPNLSSLSGLTVGRPRAARLLGRAVRDADVVVCRLPSEIGLLAAGLARLAGKPHLAEVVSCPSDIMRHHGGLRGRLYRPLLVARTRRAVAAAPLVQYVTDGFLQGRYPTRGRAIGISNVALEPADPAALERRRERVARGGPGLVLGLIGRPDFAVKGVDTALAALARLQANRPGLRLRVLGAGDPAAFAARAAAAGARDAELCALLPAGPAVLGWLDGIDLYLQPSLSEGLPRALIEAMSRGCPALGSAVGGIPELLPAGCLHRPGDAAALAGLVDRLAGDPGERLALGRRNLERCRAFDPGLLQRRRLALWGELARLADRAEEAPRRAAAATPAGGAR